MDSSETKTNSSSKPSNSPKPPSAASSKKFTPLPIDQIVTRSVVEEILAAYDPHVKALRYDCAKGTKNGDNYLSLMYTIDVEGVRDAEPVKFYIMFKTIPRNPVRIQMVQPLKLFQREIMMYNEVLSVWRSHSSFDSYPKCLHAVYCNAEPEAGRPRTDYIAMENVRVDGYKMLDRFQFLDLRHAEFVIQELAKFHTLSYNQWKGDGAAILAQYPILVDPVWIDPGLSDPINKMFMENSFPELQKLLRINGCDETTCERLATFSAGIEQRIIPVLRPTAGSSAAKFPNVINHGDPWCNNFMFKYDETGNVVAMKFVDFQVAKVGSRIIDLSYVLYTSLQIPILNEHLMRLLRLYHDTFLAHVNNPSPNLTWETFLEEWSVYRLYGLTMALIFAPAMNANPDNVPDFETLSMDDLAGKSDKKDKRDGDDKQKDKSDFSNFMKSEHIASRVINLVTKHI